MSAAQPDIPLGGLIAAEGADQRGAMYLDLEEGEGLFDDALQGTLISLGVTQESVQRLRLAYDTVNAPICSPENLADLEDACRGNRLVVIDPFLSAIGNVDSMRPEARELLTPVRQIARRNRCAVLLTQHTRKPRDNEGRRVTVDSLFGSKALAGAFDNVFLLQPLAGGGGAILEQPKRKGAKPERRGIRFDFREVQGTNVPALVASWDEGRRREESLRARLLAALRDKGGFVASKQQLLGSTKGNRADLGREVEAMIDDGVLIRESGRSIRFALAEPDRGNAARRQGALTQPV